MAIIMRYFVINEFVMNSIGMFDNFYVSFMNSYGYNHKRFMKIYDYFMYQKLILWEFNVKLYFNLVDLQNDRFDRSKIIK